MIRTKDDVLFKTARDLKIDLKEVEDIYNAFLKGLYDKVVKEDKFVLMRLNSIGTLVYSRYEYRRKNLITGTKTRPRGGTSKILVVEQANRKLVERSKMRIYTADTKYQSFKYIKYTNPFAQKKSIRYYGLEDWRHNLNTLEELEAFQEKIFYEEDIRFRK